jgi:hypothetical protein
MLEDLWNRLASFKGTEAGEAMGQLQCMPRAAVRLLRTHLPPISSVGPRRLARLFADLESKLFRVRKRATRELEKQAEVAEPALRKRLADNPPLEVRLRVEKLLRRLAVFPNRPEQLRSLRAVEVLERLASSDARVVLKTLARGAPQARLTREAMAALKRLGRFVSHSR